MSGQPSNFLPSLESLRLGVEAAVETGIGDRTAASESRLSLENHRRSPSRLAAEQRVRAAAIAGSIPAKVSQAVSASMVWDKSVCVALMELTSDEYPGPFHRSPFQAPESTLDASKLAFAGRDIWNYLKAAGFSPRLKYVMDDDIRRYKLAIVIEVSCL